jgi:hypothetical protein
MSSADEIAAAFGKVDELLLAATAAAPAVALLLTRARSRESLKPSSPIT